MFGVGVGRRSTLFVAAVTCMIAMAAPAFAGKSIVGGGLSVEKNQNKNIRVCDTRKDGRTVYAIFERYNGRDGKVADNNGASNGDCTTSDCKVPSNCSGIKEHLTFRNNPNTGEPDAGNWSRH